MDLTTLIALVAAFVAGVAVALLWRRGDVAAESAEMRERVAALTAERDGLRERTIDLDAQLSEDAERAAALGPLRESLQRVERHVGTLERDRATQFGAVREGLEQLSRATTEMGKETSSLAGSLRASSVRGQWGEVQLRRVLELSGMLSRCDFDEQATGVSSSEAAVRPDVVVHLPGEKHLVIDAKAPMAQWLDAHAEDTAPERAEQLLAGHAKALGGHVTALSDKRYWTAFSPAPEMVVCFLPTDAMLAAALRADPGLHERAMGAKVVLASPSTLLALLRTVAFTWQQDTLATEARQVHAIGAELVQRIGTVAEHTVRMGRSLTRGVEDYNALVGSLESRVLVSARRMRDLGLPGDEPAQVHPLTATPRPLTAVELLDAVSEDREALDLGLLSAGRAVDEDGNRRAEGA